MAASVDGNGQSASHAPSTQWIPAWKRLGLKLKSQTANNTDHPPQIECSPISKKRPRPQPLHNGEEDTQIGQRIKQRARIGSTHALASNTNGKDVEILSPSLRRERNGVNKKTVSFTSDTKVEDGDSSKFLIADWETHHEPSSSSKKASKDLTPIAMKPNTSKTTSHHPGKKPFAALEYLTSFYQSREKWKYNKSKEIWLLKHIFVTRDIPPAYDIALGQYLQGLKSSTTRSKLRQEAEKIVKDDQEQPITSATSGKDDTHTGNGQELRADMEDPERRQAYYEDSIQRYKRKIEKHLNEVADEELSWVSPERLAKRRRAEVTLWALSVTPSCMDTIRSSQATSFQGDLSKDRSLVKAKGTQPINAQKKRKNRTSVIELSSSSSEDESSASSTDSGDESSSAGRTSRAKKEENSNGKTSGTGTTGHRHTSVSESPESDSGEDSNPSSTANGSSDTDSEGGSGDIPTDGRQKSVISISS